MVPSSITLNNPEGRLKVTPLFDAKHVRNGTRFWHNYIQWSTRRALQTPYSRVFSNDLEWPWITAKYSLTRRIARSLIQLSF